MAGRKAERQAEGDSVRLSLYSLPVAASERNYHCSPVEQSFSSSACRSSINAFPFSPRSPRGNATLVHRSPFIAISHDASTYWSPAALCTRSTSRRTPVDPPRFVNAKDFTLDKAVAIIALLRISEIRLSPVLSLHRRDSRPIEENRKNVRVRSNRPSLRVFHSVLFPSFIYFEVEPI